MSHIRISETPYLSYFHTRISQLVIASYPDIHARVEQAYLRNTLISASLILACVASVSARVRLENRDERKQEE